MKLSVILPVYNIAPYLTACLDSVLAQSYTDWECICINDGSSDGSGDILDAYAEKDARFRVFHQANAGVSAARNFALQQVRGDYVTFVDGDDLLLPEWFATAATAIDEHHPDMVRQMYQVLLPDERRYTLMEVKPGVLRNRTELLRWGARTFITDGYLWLYFVKRELLDGVTFASQLKVKEDCIFDLYLLLRLESVVQTAYKGYLYRYRENSAVNQFHRPEVYSTFADAALVYWQEHQATYDTHHAKRALALALMYSIHLDMLEWIERYGKGHKDITKHETRCAIQTYHKRLHTLGVLSFTHLHFHWIIAYYLYLWFRLVAPIRLLKRITRWRQARMRKHRFTNHNS
ncbi:MAG: glycosyltransferase family 2 protein [bacterium]|nr:glycosyltransferase family 2 protein [bacterium]